MSFHTNLENLTTTYVLVKQHVLRLRSSLVVVKDSKSYHVDDHNIYVCHNNLLASERIQLV